MYSNINFKRHFVPIFAGMGLRSRVKAYVLLLIMLLLSLHDVFPHTHYSGSDFESHIASFHFHHDHDHEHHHGDKPDDHDHPDNEKDHTLLDYLLGQHQQTSHVPLISSSCYKGSRYDDAVVNAVLPELSQIFLHKKSFLHHYCLFDSGHLNRLCFLSDITRRGPPPIH
jgi:hypothetical protein